VTAVATGSIDLRRAPLAALRAIDFRSSARDYWLDEAALHDRLIASWAGLDDAAWRLPGAAPSDAGGPDWSLLDHVGHLVDWWELAAVYIQGVIDGGPWPSDDDYDGGDFDTFNEGRRVRFADVPPAELRARVSTAHARALEVARRLPAATIRSDAAWGWVHQVLHGHAIDHLTLIEPWADQLRSRQIGNDPFGPDPQPTRRTLDAARRRFWAEDAAIEAAFRELLHAVPETAWTTVPPGADWSLADHVAHIGGWFQSGARAIEGHTAGGSWAEMPAEGLDAYNERQVRAARGTPVDDLREQFDAGLARLRRAVGAMRDDEWLDPEGFSWAYEDLHGHVRAHHAMIGPWAARTSWPAAAAPGERLIEEDR
jgi:mycothiol maleylpyruvate isomerase-like protein/DinB family protein